MRASSAAQPLIPRDLFIMLDAPRITGTATLTSKSSGRDAQVVLLNIETELEYWREALPNSEFAAMSLSFDHFIPTIKFGYDCYLLFHGKPLAERLPEFRERYTTQVARHEQLDWRWADQIIRHTWGRMRAV